MLKVTSPYMERSDMHVNKNNVSESRLSALGGLNTFIPCINVILSYEVA